MQGEFETETFAAEFAAKQVEAFLKFGKELLKGAKEAVRYSLGLSIRNYIVNVLSKYSRTKSFMIRDEPVFLYDFFVPTDIASKRTRINQASYSEIVSQVTRCIITGTAGSGKSILMKHLLLGAARENSNVPIFVELRELNSSKLTLSQSLLQNLRDNGFEVDPK